ncbi:tetratricopeptide repeat protein [Winogradskyella psychrotolerans]|uniref:tetratricopeptide repeat-containing sensor histidine kinase n=1 Tax=Winogradskyella psychrotolerans TaxID=1344585 RepID=UPI001C06D745|nr:tetratricopeptide repeat-containing sensor histidine kinase [Winogradskyella psychrotolerans]MBU2920714.1 tetratricopeptide repeat protein [Winogradskyella psychrotolerans]
MLLFSISANQNCYGQQQEEDSTDYRRLILKPKNISDLTKGFRFYLNSKDAKLERLDTIGAIYDLRLISIALRKKGLLHESENYAVEALKLLDHSSIKDSLENESRTALYNHLGLINEDLENNDLSLNYYNKAIAIADAFNSKSTIIKNRANVYLKEERYKDAIADYLSVLDFSIENESKTKVARLYDNLGYAQSKIDHPEALGNLEKGLDMRKAVESYSGLITSYLHLAEYYSDRNQKSQALAYTDKALTLAKTSGNKYYEAHVLGFKMTLKNDKEVIRFKTLNDSINLANQVFKNQFASSKYEFFKEKKRADENEILKEKEKFKRLVVQSIAGFVILLTVFVVLKLNDKHKKEKLQQVYHTETRISKKVHDEVANDVYHVMTKLQNSDHVNEELLDDLEDIYVRTRDISKENSVIDVKGNFNAQIYDLLSSYRTKDVNVITKNSSNINWNGLSDIKKIILYRVLQELMTNMRKHSKASIVVLNFSQTHKKITIDYNDNGVGSNIIKSDGLQNAENRIESINGSITFDSEINKGFKAQVII